MTKIDIISGFLGAGKTTLIKKLLSEALKGTKVVLIENEFGEIGVDGGFLKEAGIEIKEMNSGCICCSLVGDFKTSLTEVIEKYAPERILIEPSGVGKLSDVQKAVINASERAGVEPGSSVVVVDATKCKIYMKNFGEFFINQIEYAGTIVLSRTQMMDEEKLKKVVEMIREHNAKAKIITTPWDELTGKYILDTFEEVTSFEEELLKEVEEEHHHHHDDDDEDEHEHHHHHHDDDDEDEHEHHHHHHHDEEGEAEEYGIGTYVYTSRPPLNFNKFDYLVAKKWPSGIIRAKGLCYFDDEPDKCYLFEQAGRQKSIKEAGMWFATMPEEQLARMLERDANLRRDWDPVYGDRMIKIVFIGQHLDRAAIDAFMQDAS